MQQADEQAPLLCRCEAAALAWDSDSAAVFQEVATAPGDRLWVWVERLGALHLSHHQAAGSPHDADLGTKQLSVLEDSVVGPSRPREAVLKVILSLFCAGVFYFSWMGAFVLASKGDGSIVEATLWVLAPIVTAMGFTTGIVLHARFAKTRNVNFSSVSAWPLVGCAVGAGAVYRFGPMLIVFGMFLAGTASVVARDVVLGVKETAGHGDDPSPRDL